VLRTTVTRRLMAATTAVGAAATVAVASSPVAGAATPRARVGDVAPRIAISTVGHPLRPTRHLSVTIEMQSRNALALKSFASAVSTPGSREYGHYLTVRRFARRFGAPRPHAAEVANQLRASGLHVGALTRNDMQLPVSGTVRQLDRAFAVREVHVRTTSGRRTYANDVAPTLPVSVAGYVQTVAGLDDLTPAHPAGLQRPHVLTSAARLRSHARAQVHADVATGGPQLSSSGSCATAYGYETPYATSGPITHGVGESADEIADAYGFSSLYGGGSDLGQGQTIALFEEDTLNASEISAFGTCYGITPNYHVIRVAGESSPDGDVGESDLDVEVLSSEAPDATIDVYQGNDDVAILNAMVASGAQVLSESWDECEAIKQQDEPGEIQSENTILEEAAAQGQSYFVASGDSGSTACQQATEDSATPNESLTVQDPASQPFATAVGGTNLFYAGTGGPEFYTPTADPSETASESVWNDGLTRYNEGSFYEYVASASSGGISSVWTMPSYQSSAAASVGVINPDSSAAPCASTSDCRELPDVSADADPYTGYIVDASTYGWTVLGGTSAAAPLWAAFTALSNASPSCAGSSLGFLDPSLYALAGSSYATDFNDVTGSSVLSGADSNDPFADPQNPTGYPTDPDGDHYVTRTGYDMATGLGSMKAGPLSQALCADRSDTVSVTTPGAQTSTVGTPVSVQVSASSSANEPLTYSATGLPAGLVIDPSTGVISATPTTAGTSSVTVTATDTGDHSASTQAFAWTVSPAAAAAPAPAAPAPAAPAPTTTTPPATPPVTTTKVTATTDRPSNLSLNGLAKGSPALSFAWTVGTGEPALTALQVKLPAGLSFASAKKVAKGLIVRSGGAKVAYTVKLAGGVVTITFKKPASNVSLNFAKGALKITAAEAEKVRKGKVTSVTLKVTGIAQKTKTARTVTVGKLS
jgi:subtilase family serine protease